MKIVLTGATGFLGRHVADRLCSWANVVALVRASSRCERLLAQGVRCVQADLSDVSSLASGCDSADIVIHLAGAVDFTDDWELCRRVNLEGTRNLITACRQAGVRRLIHVSSIVAVGATQDRTVLDEEAPWNLGRLRVPYITTKRDAEQLALTANCQDLEVVVVNPGCVIGPEDFTQSEFGVLCHRFWKGRLRVWFAGGGNYVDVRDVADGIAAACRRGHAGRRYLLTHENLSHGEFFAALAKSARQSYPRLQMPVTLAQMAANVANLLPRREGKRPYLSAEQARLLGWYFFFDSSRAKSELGFSPRPLSQTLEQTHAFWMTKKAA
jgi:dihydroflavonol-4-reductase